MRRCLEKDAERAAAEAEADRRRARWLPRPCAGPKCQETVIPRKPWAIYCSSACRVRAHRAKTQQAAAVGS